MIVFNGEIYNHRDLRPLAEAGGVRLRSQTDTEVLLELLAREGADPAGRCRGMFAFAWWEAGAARLTLVRDRFGIKPLVWVRQDFSDRENGALSMRGLAELGLDPRLLLSRRLQQSAGQ